MTSVKSSLGYAKTVSARHWSRYSDKIFKPPRSEKLVWRSGIAWNFEWFLLTQQRTIPTKLMNNRYIFFMKFLSEINLGNKNVPTWQKAVARSLFKISTWMRRLIFMRAALLRLTSADSPESKMSIKFFNVVKCSPSTFVSMCRFITLNKKI